MRAGDSPPLTSAPRPRLGRIRSLLTQLQLNRRAGCSEAHEKETDGSGRLDRDRQECGNCPRELESRLERRERPPLVRFGGIALDDFGNATGRIKVQTDSWEQMVKIVGEMNLVSQPALVALSTEMARLAAAQGDLQRLEFDLNIRRGAVFLGPIQLQ